MYASFGTAQNRNRHSWNAVVKAAVDLDAQVVLSLGGAETSELPGKLPDNLLVVPFAPQLEMLDKAVLMITHAGMNSTLESLTAGVPMVAVPIAHDQPGIAARIERTGTGVRVPAQNVNRSVCETRSIPCSATLPTLSQPNAFSESLRQGEAWSGPPDIIERVAATGQPVLH